MLNSALNFNSPTHYLEGWQDSDYRDECAIPHALEAVYNGSFNAQYRSMKTATIIGDFNIEDEIDKELDLLLEEILAAEAAEEERLYTPSELLDDPTCELTKAGKEKLTKLQLELDKDRFIISDLAVSMSKADLSNYISLKNMGVKKAMMVIDFVDIRIITKEPHTYSTIKRHLTSKTQTKHYVDLLNATDGADKTGNTFVIRYHDVKNKKDLLKRLSHLSLYCDDIYANATIEKIELALDFYFYDAPLPEMVLALFKSMRVPCGIKNARLYRKKGETIRLDRTDSGLTPITHKDWIYYISHGWNICINNRSDDLYIHAYLKETDNNGKRLATDEHRARLETTLSGKALIDAVGIKNSTYKCPISSLNKVIRVAVRSFQFVKVRDDASKYVKHIMGEFPRLNGREKATYNKNRYTKPQLSNSTKTLAPFNKFVLELNRNLARKFA